MEAHLASDGDSEGLGAEHELPGQIEQAGVHGNGELHGQLWRYDARDDHGAVQEELEAVPVGILRSKT